MDQADSMPREISLDVKVRFLGGGGAFPDAAEPVRCIETHMAWVFLAGDRVLKMKKPVVHPFLDFRTLAARETVCREEVRLNRRLAGDVYRGVVPLTLDDAGRLAVGGCGAVVDWLVEMRRLPAERMLDEAIRLGTLSRADVLAVAARLVAFYRAAERSAASEADYREHFAQEQAESRRILLAPDSGLDSGAVAALLDEIDGTLRRDQPLSARVAAGCIVEGHGDLRPEHICLLDPPVIIDCLEFNARLRQVDPLDELVFLHLECTRLGADWAGRLLLGRCLADLGEEPPPALLRFYWIYRACTRARLSLAHLLEPHPRTPAKWLPLTRRYLALAAEADLRLGLPAAR